MISLGAGGMLVRSLKGVQMNGSSSASSSLVITESPIQVTAVGELPSSGSAPAGPWITTKPASQVLQRAPSRPSQATAPSQPSRPR